MPPVNMASPANINMPPVNMPTANMASPANMVHPTDTLLGVEAWANAEFPRFFAPLYNMKNPQCVQLRNYDGIERDGNLIQQPMSIIAVPVGEINAGAIVFVRLAHNSRVHLYIEKTYSQEVVPGGLLVASAVNVTKDIRFYVPFKCPIDANSPASIARLESIIRWHYLVGGVPSAVQGNLGYFKMCFRDACRDVARAVGAVADDDDAGAYNNSPASTPPDLIADTDVSGNSGATAFNKLSNKMDDAYHDFKSRLFQQVSERQEAVDKRLAEVGARNQQLEGIIASLDEDVAKLTKELEETKSKLKAAEQTLSAERRTMRA